MVLFEETIGTRFPALAQVDEPILWPGASTRLSNVLRRVGNPAWSKIASQTPDQLLATWQSFGSKSLQELLRRAANENASRFALSEGLEPLGAPLPLEREWNPVADSKGSDVPALVGEDAQILAWIEELRAWGYAELAASTLGEVVAAVSEEVDVPAHIRAAGASLLDLPTLPRTGDPRYCLEASLDFLREAIEAKSWFVLDRRTLAPNRRVRRTLDELGVELGVTRERVRQLEKKALENLNERLGRLESQVAVRAARALAGRLGVATRSAEGELLVDEFLEERHVPASRLDLRRLLVWLAGPFECDGSWLVAGRIRELESRVRGAVTSVLGGGAVGEDDLLGAVQDLGFVDLGSARAFAEAVGGYRVIDGKAVDWSGGVGDRAARVLTLSGEPLSRDDLHVLVGDVTIGTLSNALSGDDRFRRIDRHVWGLAVWGGDEYTGVVDLMSQEIENRGGSADLDELAVDLASRFSIADTSVRMYAGMHPRFVRAGSRVRLREVDEPVMVDADVRMEATCYRIEGLWRWRRVVDHDVLRGSGLSVPLGFAVEVGLEPGEVLELWSPFGPAALRWTGMRPTISSLREAAESLNLDTGDHLFVSVAEDQVQISSLSKHQLADLDDVGRLAAMVGLSEGEAGRDRLASMIAALDLHPESTFADVAARLRARQEDELAALVPVGETNADDVLRQLGL